MSVEFPQETEIVRKIRDAMGEDLLEAKIPRPRRVFIHITKKAIKEALQYLTQKADFTHLSTITGLDIGKEIEAIYHLSRDGRIELSLKVRVLKDKPSLPTITDIIPGAVLYEREVHELLGIVFEGHPDLSPLLLPEGWPDGVYPLRKEWTIERLEEEVQKGGKQ